MEETKRDLFFCMNYVKNKCVLKIYHFVEVRLGMETVPSSLFFLWKFSSKQESRKKYQRKYHSLSIHIQQLLTFCHICFIKTHIHSMYFAVLFESRLQTSWLLPLRYSRIHLKHEIILMIAIPLWHLRKLIIIPYYLISSLYS